MVVANPYPKGSVQNPYSEASQRATADKETQKATNMFEQLNREARERGYSGQFEAQQQATQQYAQSEQQKKAQAGVKQGEVAIIKQNAIERYQPKTTEQAKLGLGESIITAYHPSTKEELAKSKSIETQYKVGQAVGAVASVPERLGLSKITSTISNTVTGVLGIFTGETYKQSQVYVPTQEELFKRDIERRTSYNAGKSGKELYPVYEITAGEKLASDIFQSSVTANINVQNKVQAQDEKIIDKYNQKAQSELNLIQLQVDAGKVKIADAQKQWNIKKEQITQSLATERNKIVNQIVKQQSDLTKTEQDKFIKSYETSVALSTTQKLAGYVLRGASYNIPVAGPVILTSDIFETVKSLPELRASIQEKPVQTLKEIGLSILGTSIGAGTTGYVKAKIETAKIQNAIRNADVVRASYKDLTKEDVVKLLSKSESEFNKIQLQDVIDKSKSIKYIETKLKAKNSADASYLPDVRGRYVEFLDAQGKIVERINIGQIVSKYKNKSVTQNALSQASGKIDSDLRFYARSILFDEGKTAVNFPTGSLRTKYMPLKYLETYEKLELVKMQKGEGVYKNYYKLYGKGEIGLIKEVSKPKAKDITRIYDLGKPTIAQIDEMLSSAYKESKSYGKSKIEFIGKKLKTKINIRKTGVDEYLVGVQKKSYGVGISEFERTALKKMTRASKPYKFLEIKETKPQVYGKQSVSKKIQRQMLQQLPEPIRMQVYAQTYGKQFNSPIQQALTFESAMLSAEPLAMSVEMPKSMSKGLAGSLQIRNTLQFISSQPKVVQNQAKVSQLQLRELQQVKQQPKIINRLEQNLAQEMSMKQMQQLNQKQNLQQKQQLNQLSKLSLRQIQAQKQEFAFDLPKLTFDFIPTLRISKEEYQKKKRKKENKEYLDRITRAYQSSVGAVSLGISVSKTPKQKFFTGLELRPVVYEKQNKNDNYLKKLNKMFI